MAIKITKEEFEQKFGTSISSGSGSTQPTTPSFGQRVKGVIQGAGEKVADIVTGEGEYANQSVLRRATGAVGTAFSAVPKVAFQALPSPARSGLEKVGEGIGKGFNAVTNKIGDSPQLQKWVMEHPDAASKLEDIAGIGANLGEISGNILTANAGAKGLQTAADVGLKTMSKAAAPVGRVLKATGEKAYGLTVTPQKQTSMAVQKYQAKQGSYLSRAKDVVAGKDAGRPITEANTAARQGLMGTEWEIGVQANQAQQKLWNEVLQPKLAAVKGQVNMKSFLKEVQKEINKTADLTRKGELMTALQKVGDDYARVRTPVNLEKLQAYKEDWAKFIPDSAYQGKPIAGALKEVHDIMAGKARDVIYKHVGKEGQQAYIDYGNLKSIMDAGIKSIGDPAKRSLGRNAWELIMDKAVTPVATTAGRVLYKTGDGLELMGKSGAKTVRDLISKDITPASLLKMEEQIKNYKPQIGLSTQDVSTMPKVHMEDQQVMKNFIDAVRVNKKIPDQLKLDATRIAKHYGFKIPVNPSGLADRFDDFLARFKQNFGAKKIPFKD